MNETVLTHARKHGPHRKKERKWLLENLDVQIYVLINFLNLTHRINNSIIASIVTSKKERERKMIERFNIYLQVNFLPMHAWQQSASK